ncbi:MAG: DUF1036 domain-containing protein [Candidatus Eremiobacteraeota bacterium]|nr:DUF1036 domain-containing protein [Candidatus Eremiobacteraeota bacterium]MBV8365801.1 DUF1036 domain-containing protein [Candidatus Eremiobacteraeota bacterium]
MKKIRFALPLAAIALLAVMVVHPAPAGASFRVCNQTTQGRLWVADAVTWERNGDSYGESQGWWGIDQGGCKTLISNDIGSYRIYIYAYAEGDTSATWSGAKNDENNYFCLDTVKFMYKGDDMDTPCSTGSSRNFRYVDTSSYGDYTYTLYD